jgi:hypothetical protein
MCSPLAAVSAGVSAVGAIGQHQSAQAQADAQNAAAKSNYKHQLQVRQNNWDRERFRYNRQLVQYGKTLTENASATNRAFAGQQQKLNNIYKQAGFKQQASLVKLTQGSDQMAAAGRTGRSAQRLDNQIVSQFGRNQAIAAESLTGAGNAFRNTVGAIRRQQISDNNRAYENVAVQPMPDAAPPPPVMTPGPSGLSLAAGLGSAALSGIGTYNELVPETQRIGYTA